MSLEQKLRDNLKTAADALVVPEPDRTSSRSHAPGWKRGFGVAAIGAAAVLALALPALVMSSGEVPLEDASTPSTVRENAASSAIETPSSTLGAPTTLPPFEEITLGEITVDDYLLVLTAIPVDGEEPPPATVTLQATRIGATEPTDDVVVGNAGGFFWNVLTGSDAVCDLSAEPTTDGAEVAVQILASQSVGCLDTFSFDLVSGQLFPAEQAPDETARQFVASWQFGQGEMMAKLAEPEAVRQADGLDTPVDPVFSYCEGAAGSTYCTFEVEGGELVARVRNDPPAKVIELNFVPD